MAISRLRVVPWHKLRADLALPAIGRVLEGSAAERVIDRTLRTNRGLSRDERTALVEAIFGVALWRRRLQWHAQSTEPAKLLSSLLEDLAGFGGAKAGPQPTRLADRWSLPDWLEAHLQAELGDEAEAFCAAISEPGPICLRANRLLCTREELAGRLRLEGIETLPTSKAPDGLVIQHRGANIYGSRAWWEGWFEPQDEGSQLVGLLAKDTTTLDLCAGAGGKSLLLAATGSKVLAYDIDRDRLARLRVRAKRAHAEVEILDEPRHAETILIDAPCSELGTLRRGPDMRWRIDPNSLEKLPEIQTNLLATAARAARKRIVYVTCTLNRAENEKVAERFDSEHSEFHRTGTLKLFPHRDGTDGFFAATWERR
ncbi:MAG TPA: RsmB/NOP family class I SAM-dependent RNA methyltransferase [Myxococcales bacterium]|jgi:16S rRNA (cytosine967-C5)-methyltransferase|nr:RsmB/NOP family class I SAM-dependent RNA methyltransferase [Myxococcales bacterium]